MTSNDISEEEASQNKPSLKKYTFPRFRFWLHVLQVIFTLLSVCMVAPVIAVQLAFKGSSAPGPNYTLFVIIFSFLIPLCLAFFPWIYETKNQLKQCGKFFSKPRTNVIFSSLCSLLWLTAGIAITTYAFNPSTCVLDSNEKADGYTSAWTAQCNCAKVAVVFVWITCLAWIITLLVALVVFWKQKQLVQQNLQQIAKTNHEATVQVQVTNPVTHPLQDHVPVQDPAMTPPVSEPYYPPLNTSPYPPPLGSIQYPYYNDPALSYPPQPSIPLAVMPDPQHYRQQHRVV